MPTNIIRLLPDALANQIAAGEVIQRPASVVKELVENAVDAHSTHIKVVIKDAGKTLIQVIDDGTGMSEVDARMSLEKHATSKISQADDLFNIRTMGFRGEALPSIAAIAQVEIETRLKEAELGTRLVIEGSKIKFQEPVATSQGTTISVKNLFFNVPARRNFLKTAPIETKHIIEEFQHIALARPDIAFSLYQNDQETYHLPITKLAHRIVHLFGEAYKKQLIPCQENTDIVQIHGYIGNPSYAKKTRGEQFFFVNNRYIKNAYLHHAIKTEFEELIPKDSFPFYVLFIDIAPERIDVNVHPTKTEIKFDDERTVYSILQATVRQALAQHISPVLDFEQNINFDPLGLQEATKTKNSTTSTDKAYTSLKKFDTPSVNQKEWEELFKRINEHSPSNSTYTQLDPQLIDLADKPPLITASITPSTIIQEAIQTPSVLEQEKSENIVKMQLHKTYILASVKSGLLLIDQHAAHERILYEKYLQNIKNNTGISQQLLFPHQIELNPADFALIHSYESALTALGFAIENFGKNSIILVGYPAEAAQHNPKQLLENILEQIKWNQSHLSLPTQENVVCSLAKHAAIQNGKKLTNLEMDSLVDQLFGCNNPNHTPDGKKIWTIITLEELANLLKG
ncbi:MAG: DNA mismatch repair protein MutL [Candidatus Amoebophilus sp. 36-38]|nr:MAG: DNA mismatch repair protein MutL [Candidatus Amoebophilus sp. 36-38]